ncbi:Gfo/Idh/MocA family oxidoreductase [Nocardioidaceae bacterium]|nr:Gfo/Idh/MocA family oxidoreductase [Nocardioidaceae bacterium]
MSQTPSVPPTRWAILGTGKIAGSFARDLAVTPGAELVAVGSRSAGSAEAFCAEHGGAAYATYESLLADAASVGVDAVYVSSPHSHHDAHARMVLDAGLPVLCEKPLTLDAHTTADLLAYARDRGVFCMEAMWTACHPTVRETARLLAAGELGQPRQLRAGLGFAVPADPDSRMWDPALGASAVLDMGIYPLTLADLLLGEPATVQAVGTVDDRGVDTDVAMALAYDSGAVAALTVTMTSHPATDALVATSTGTLVLEAPFHHPPRVVFTPAAAGSDNDSGGPDAREERVITGEEPVLGSGYGNEAAEVARCLAAGRLESTLWPHAASVRLAEQMDRVRHLVGGGPLGAG